MRKTCLNSILELADSDPRVFFVGSDLGYKVLEEFRLRHPRRFLMEGVSEAAVLGLAAGLSMDGKIVYVNTIATFLVRRGFEQLAIDLCQQNLPVRLVGNGGGLVYAPLGATHMAFEDVSLLRALPNITILSPCDAQEMRRLMPLTLDHPGPVYIRLGKGGDPVVSSPDAPLAIGRAVPMADGGDVLLLTSGIMLGHVLAARELLARDGISCAVLHFPTLKPLDDEAIRQAAGRAGLVVTVEENALNGGLGEAVAALLLERGPVPRAFLRLGLPDRFPDHYGSQADILRMLGLDAQGIAKSVRARMQAL